MASKETTQKTFIIAGVLCIVCSALVSAAAIGLKERQQANIVTDKRMNILAAAGILEDGMDINQVFEDTVEIKYIDIESGDYLSEIPAPNFDSVKAAKVPDLSVEIPADVDKADIKRRAKASEVFFFKENGQVSKIILPIRGKGLWSTMIGFAALNTDANTISGITFYSHAETPGLGGEIDNPNWKAKWPGKVIYGADGEVELQVLKGNVVPGNPKEKYQIDGLAGATITARGVSNLMNYWFGDQGYKKFLAKFGGEK